MGRTQPNTRNEYVSLRLKYATVSGRHQNIIFVEFKKESKKKKIIQLQFVCSSTIFQVILHAWSENVIFNLSFIFHMRLSQLSFVLVNIGTSTRITTHMAYIRSIQLLLSSIFFFSWFIISFISFFAYTSYSTWDILRRCSSSSSSRWMLHANLFQRLKYNLGNFRRYILCNWYASASIFA